jgi:hypothetical protein
MLVRKPKRVNKISEGKQDKRSPEDKSKFDKERNPWKYIAPKDGEPTTKELNGFTWHWCSKHQKWVCRTESDCRGVGAFNRKGRNVAHPATTGTDDATTAASTVTTPSVHVNRAYMSLSDNGSLFD